MYKKAALIASLFLLLVGIKNSLGAPSKTTKEIKINKCGQACTFNTAQEAMSLLSIYFQDYMVGGDQKQKEERKKNIKNCLAGTGSDCDKEKLLEASLHYAMGKVIRQNILKNAAGAESLRTVGLDEDKWDRDLDTEIGHEYLLVEEEKRKEYELQGLELRVELRERKNFRILKKDIKEANERILAAQTQGKYAEALKEFKGYLSSYAGPEETLFSMARKLKDSKTHVIDKDKKGDIRIKKNKYTYSETQYSKLNEKLKQTKEELIKNKEKDVFKRLSENEENMQTAASEIIESCNPPPCKIDQNNRKALQNLLTKGEMEVLEKPHALEQNEALMEKMTKISKPEQIHYVIAENLNRRVTQLIAERKEAKEKQRKLATSSGTPLEKEHITYQRDPERFDEFLDSMWPDNSI